MASEYQVYSDFPHWALPLRSWPEFGRVMFSASATSLLIESIITDAVDNLSIISDGILCESLISDSLNLNSIIL
jgi:hypothetical protein